PLAGARSHMAGTTSKIEALDEAVIPPVPSPNGGEPPIGFDESAESAFLADARARGEAAPAARPAAEAIEETDSAESKALPPLADLVNRIPAEVRETLDDLFRAKFIAVRRVPKSALK